MQLYLVNLDGGTRIFSNITKALAFINKERFIYSIPNISRFELNGNTETNIKLRPSKFVLYKWNYKTSNRTKIDPNQLNSILEIEGYFINNKIKSNNFTFNDNKIIVLCDDCQYYTEVTEWVIDDIL